MIELPIRAVPCADARSPIMAETYDDLLAPIGPHSIAKSLRRGTAVKSSRSTRSGTSARSASIGIGNSIGVPGQCSGSVVGRGGGGGSSRRDPRRVRSPRCIVGIEPTRSASRRAAYRGPSLPLLPSPRSLHQKLRSTDPRLPTYATQDDPGRLRPLLPLQPYPLRYGRIERPHEDGTPIYEFAA